MSDRQHEFERLARLAATDTPPRVDVTGAVVSRIQSTQLAENDLNRLLAVCSSVATAAAVVAVAAATWAWYSWSDPVMQVFSQAHLVMQ